VVGAALAALSDLLADAVRRGADPRLAGDDASRLAGAMLDIARRTTVRRARRLAVRLTRLER
jgi:hypothetical protein